MSGKRQIPIDIENGVVADYASGLRASDVANKYGLNRKTVTTIVRRNGGKVRGQQEASGRAKDDMGPFENRIVELRKLGLSQQQIATQVGKSQALISRVLISRGMPTKMKRSGADHGSWRGGRIINELGYVSVLVSLDDEMASMRGGTGYVLEHRLVVARWLGRPLSRHETVHHINGDNGDNRLENLQLRQGLHGKGVVMKCACCGSMDIISTKIAEAH